MLIFGANGVGGYTVSFARVKDPPLQKINAQKLVTIFLKMHKLGAKLTTPRSAKNFWKCIVLLFFLFRCSSDEWLVILLKVN